jgi:hypothetical protein
MVKHRDGNVTDPDSGVETPESGVDIGESENEKTQLPSVETLNADSDFTPFLKEGVPSLLKRAALRKLWKTDPILANLDGLNDYDDDFVKMGVGKIVKTAYTISQKFIAKDQEGTLVEPKKREAVNNDTASNECETPETSETAADRQTNSDSELS